MVDLMKLEGDMLTGTVTRDDGKMIEIITPVFRASFPRLDRPEKFQGQGEPRFTCGMIFNVSDPASPALVKMDSVMGASLSKVAAANSLSLKAGGVSPFGHGEKYNQEGNLLDGYTEHTAWATISKYPKNEESRVQVFNAAGAPAKADTIYGGCYARALIQLYKPRNWTRISMGIGWIQFVADGVRFGGEDTEYDAVPGIPGAADVSAPNGQYDQF